MDPQLLLDLAAQWENAAERARQVGDNPRTTPSASVGNAVAGSLLGCAQALRTLCEDET